MSELSRWANLAAEVLIYAGVGYVETHSPKPAVVPQPVSSAPLAPVPTGFINTLPPIELKLPLVSIIAKSALDAARLAPDLETRERIQNDALRRIAGIVRAKPDVTEGRGQ